MTLAAGARAAHAVHRRRVLGAIVAIVIFVMAFRRRARAFHARGTVCRGELTALDDVVGPRLAGSARVRLSSASHDENSPEPSILGLAIKLGGDQDLPLASFESFIKASEATRTTDVADYLGNQFSSVTPWYVGGLGIVWLRAIPDPAANVPKTGTRVERLDADIAAGRGEARARGARARRAPTARWSRGSPSCASSSACPPTIRTSRSRCCAPAATSCRPACATASA